LYNKVAGDMSVEAATQNPAGDRREAAHDARSLFELAWAAICPPSLAILTWILTGLWQDAGADEDSGKGISLLLFPLVLGGMTILAAVIYLDCRAVEKFRSAAGDIRVALGVSTAVTLIFLSVWTTAEAGRSHLQYAEELALFLCLPVLLVCTPLLWYSARAIELSYRRLVMMALFVCATALVELKCQSGNLGNAEEQLFMWHSLLVALALAILLGIWGAKEFRRR
jgi:hypothetical protein